MIDETTDSKVSLINPSAPGFGQPEGLKNLSYPFPKGFNSPHWRYWKAFAYSLRNNAVSTSVLAEMLAEYQQYRDNAEQREKESLNV